MTRMFGANEANVVRRAIGNNDQEVIDSPSLYLLYCYWVRKLRNQDGRYDRLVSPQRLATMMVEWDMAVGAWVDMEQQTGLITEFGHMGPKASYRKVLSYDGVPENSCDQGNWVYAVCLRHMLCLFGESDWRCVGTKELGDEKAGDVLEAIWGLLYHRENQGPLASVIADSLVPTQQLQRYCKCMTRVVLMFVQVWPHFIRSHEWPSSEEFANELI